MKLGSPFSGIMYFPSTYKDIITLAFIRAHHTFTLGLWGRHAVGTTAVW
jgi:hypothetical protein